MQKKSLDNLLLNKNLQQLIHMDSHPLAEYHLICNSERPLVAGQTVFLMVEMVAGSKCGDPSITTPSSDSMQVESAAFEAGQRARTFLFLLAVMRDRGVRLYEHSDTAAVKDINKRSSLPTQSTTNLKSPSWAPTNSRHDNAGAGHETPAPISPESTSGLQGWLAVHLRGRPSTTAEVDPSADAAPIPTAGGPDIYEIAITPSELPTTLSADKMIVMNTASLESISNVQASNDVNMKDWNHHTPPQTVHPDLSLPPFPPHLGLHTPTNLPAGSSQHRKPSLVGEKQERVRAEGTSVTPEKSTVEVYTSDSIAKFVEETSMGDAAAQSKFDEPIAVDEAHSRTGTDSAAALAATSSVMPVFATPDAMTVIETPDAAPMPTTQSVHRNKGRVRSGGDVRNFVPVDDTPAREVIARRAKILSSIEGAAADRHVAELMFQSVMAELIARRCNNGAGAGVVDGKDHASASNGGTSTKSARVTDPDQTPRTSIAAPPRKIAQVSNESWSTVYGSQQDIDTSRRESVIVPVPAEAAPVFSRHLKTVRFAISDPVVDAPRVSDYGPSLIPSATTASAFELPTSTDVPRIAARTTILVAPQTIQDPDRMEVIGRKEPSHLETPPVVLPREQKEKDDEPHGIMRSAIENVLTTAGDIGVVTAKEDFEVASTVAAQLLVHGPSPDPSTSAASAVQLHPPSTGLPIPQPLLNAARPLWKRGLLLLRGKIDDARYAYRYPVGAYVRAEVP
ncbi:hypothetical protein BDK51DRAFT_39257 [Blyttiomyces helicus]|uniref:Uncharacterized protein n=1 Tax=Blyttiomyces helicus TaxID=388810 RepID=A0A4P9WFD7_9FUNG|nr:hypothetical protein BDK51DRAFT_39257 [Blyttiomyces helicus]|eukprot:RKO90018.1 hypothetical protein BDK51DRAFT_39257 [Blyttiomyces helicus]